MFSFNFSFIIIISVFVADVCRPNSEGLTFSYIFVLFPLQQVVWLPDSLHSKLENSLPCFFPLLFLLIHLSTSVIKSQTNVLLFFIHFFLFIQRSIRLVSRSVFYRNQAVQIFIRRRMKCKSNRVYLLGVGSLKRSKAKNSQNETKLNKPKEENLSKIRNLSVAARGWVLLALRNQQTSHTHTRTRTGDSDNIERKKNIQMFRRKNRWQWHKYVFSWKLERVVRLFVWFSIYLLRSTCAHRQTSGEIEIVLFTWKKIHFSVCQFVACYRHTPCDDLTQTNRDRTTQNDSNVSAYGIYTWLWQVRKHRRRNELRAADNVNK